MAQNFDSQVQAYRQLRRGSIWTNRGFPPTVMRLRQTLLFAILSFSLQASAADQSWLRISSDHFIVITDAGDKKGHEVAARFEQMRGVFAQLLMRNRVRLAEPIEIIALRNDKEYASVAPLVDGDPTTAPGFFLSGEDRIFIVLNLFEPDSWRAIEHPFAHYLLNYNYPPTHSWFDEGFAEYFASLYLGGKSAGLGSDPELNLQNAPASVSNAPSPGNMKPLTEILNNPVWLDWADLLQMKNRIVNGQEGTHHTLFYAQSWILMHYLINKDKLSETGKYFQLVQIDRLPVQQAVQQAFGMSLPELDKTVKDYFRSLTQLQDNLQYAKNPSTAAFEPSLVQVPLQSTVEDIATSTKPISLAEGEALLNEMAVRIPERREEAVQRLEALASGEKTETAVAHRALAWAHVQKRETHEAFEELNAAMQLDGSDPWVRMGLALAAYHSGEQGAKIQGLANMMESLHIVLEEFPDFAEAYDMLGWARLVGGGGNAAVEAMKMAVQLNPRSEEYQLRLARAYLAAKKFDEAKATLERLKQSQTPEIARAAKKDLTDLPFLEKYGIPPAQDKPVQQTQPAATVANHSKTAAKNDADDDEQTDDSPAKPAPQEPQIDKRPVRFLKATLLTVDCSRQPEAVLTVSGEGKTLKLRTADYKSALVIGSSGFSCSWKDIPVNVNYRASGKADGDLVSIELH